MLYIISSRKSEPQLNSFEKKKNNKNNNKLRTSPCFKISHLFCFVAAVVVLFSLLSLNVCVKFVNCFSCCCFFFLQRHKQTTNRETVSFFFVLFLNVDRKVEIIKILKHQKNNIEELWSGHHIWRNWDVSLATQLKAYNTLQTCNHQCYHRIPDKVNVL